jgi:hypothetical protein
MGTRRSRRWSRLVPLAVLVGLLVPASPVGAVPATRWRLEDYHQVGCFSDASRDVYFGVWLRGTWTSPVDVQAKGLVRGSSYTTEYVPIRPGSSDGHQALAYVHVTMRRLPSIGQYPAVMWASDGSQRQRVPIVLDVRDHCGY